jgi:hemoglobin
MTTLYDKLSGAATVDLAVEKFYTKVLVDKRVQHFFAQTDMQQQKKHQKSFMTYAFGGAKNWDGRSLRDAHKELVIEMGLTDSHFDAIAENLVATVVELEVPHALIDEVVQIVGSVANRNDVLNIMSRYVAGNEPANHPWA